MQIEHDTLRAAFVALREAHAYIAHPASITPNARRRIATHRVPNHEFASMERRVREALKVLNDIMQADPVPT